MKRNQFLKASATGLSVFLADPLRTFSQTSQPEPYKLETVKEFVIAGHANLAKVKEMLAEFPNLLYCRYDWGNGDFEEALEGAGHMGNTEIAEYLVGMGARPNIYVLTMLGHTSIVKAILEKYPALLNGKGPHGFTLLHHAIKGGEAAKELLDYLKAKGLKESHIKIK